MSMISYLKVYIPSPFPFLRGGGGGALVTRRYS